MNWTFLEKSEGSENKLYKDKQAPPTGSDGEMKPHEALNHWGQLVPVVVHYWELHVLMAPPTGRVHNHNQLDLSHTK